MGYQAWETKVVNVVDLFLDEENVRLDNIQGKASQDELAHDIFVNQDAFALAQSIARHGLFQHELLIVIKDRNRLVVIEGNRRTAALKGLIQPNLVPLYSARLEQAKRASSHLPIDSLEVKIAPSRDAALQTLAAIHTTESRKPWSPLRQAYFYYAQVKSKSKTMKSLTDEYPNADVPRFIRMWEMHQVARSINYDTAEESAQVADQQGFPVTTLERIYNSEPFQSAFGVSFDKFGQATIHADTESFKAAFKRIIVDIVNKNVTSRKHNTAKDIKGYIDSIEKPTLTDTKHQAASKAYKPEKPEKSESKRRIPNNLVSKDIVCSLPYPAIQKMLEELQTLSYKKYPNVTHDFLRTFLECSMKAYFEHKKINIPKKGKYTYLDNVLAEAETHFETVNKPLVQVVKVIRGSAGNTVNTYIYSLDHLNASNHNHQTMITSETVKDVWLQMENLIKFILNPK